MYYFSGLIQCHQLRIEEQLFDLNTNRPVEVSINLHNNIYSDN